MAMSLSKSQAELAQMPLVELAWEILKAKKEPFYFRDLMNEIQVIRGMSEAEVMDIIARLYTEINIDGRFICIGQNVWGLKRWYPVDKVADKTVTKRFVRSTGDAFSDDDEDLDADFDEVDAEEDEEEEVDLFKAKVVNVDAESDEEVAETDGDVDTVSDDDVEDEDAEYTETALEEEDTEDDEDEDDAY